MTRAQGFIRRQLESQPTVTDKQIKGKKSQTFEISECAYISKVHSEEPFFLPESEVEKHVIGDGTATSKIGCICQKIQRMEHRRVEEGVVVR